VLLSGAYEPAHSEIEFVPAVSRNVIDHGVQDSISTKTGNTEPLAIKVNFKGSHRIRVPHPYAALSTHDAKKTEHLPIPSNERDGRS
jgi:hypothetical protein